MANNFFGATSLTGGGTGALDAIDGTDLADLDAAFVVTLAYIYFYSLDVDSAADESSPDVISPDANAGNKRWILTGVNATISVTQWGALGALVEWTAWVPTLTGGADLSGYNTARYYRIGDICFFRFEAIDKNVTTAGYVQITLPFTSANTGNFSLSAQIHNGTAWIGSSYTNIAPNSDYILISKTVAVTEWVGNETGVTFRVSGFFEIA